MNDVEKFLRFHYDRLVRGWRDENVVVELQWLGKKAKSASNCNQAPAVPAIRHYQIAPSSTSVFDCFERGRRRSPSNKR
jgi:hypothetical protein